MKVEIVGADVQVYEPGSPVLSACIDDKEELMALARLLRDTGHLDSYYKVDALIWQHHLSLDMGDTLLSAMEAEESLGLLHDGYDPALGSVPRALTPEQAHKRKLISIGVFGFGLVAAFLIGVCVARLD